MKESKFYRVIRPLVNAFISVFIHPKYIGLSNIPKDGSYVLAGNHISILDPLLVMSSTKRSIHFLAKDELWKGFKKIIFANLGLIPVNRREKDNFALKEAEKYLFEGKVIGIFPEGTTNKKNELLSFKVGAVKMAYDTNTKIVPFAIKGRYGFFRKISISFGKPIYVKSNNFKEESVKLRNIITKMKEG
ncbi:MAG: 1-acyl-sn-glycerol-3-phosphate acyltransferase [Bacilli bacterium]|nr:1-acyl-sn-glycerol-3-phosphate acyltransferase [Bacilli bacterium]